MLTKQKSFQYSTFFLNFDLFYLPVYDYFKYVEIPSFLLMKFFIKQNWQKVFFIQYRKSKELSIIKNNHFQINYLFHFSHFNFRANYCLNFKNYFSNFFLKKYTPYFNFINFISFSIYKKNFFFEFFFLIALNHFFFLNFYNNRFIFKKKCLNSLKNKNFLHILNFNARLL